MAKSKASVKKVGRGRPQLYPLTTAQENRVRALTAKGWTSKEIQEEMGIHEFAVLRVRRAS